MAQRLFITGGAGYLGAELVQRALAAGWQVTATYFSSHPAIAGARWLPLDIRDASGVDRAFAAQRPDVLIHTAYRQDGPDMWSATVRGTEVIAQACQASGVRLIHLSSDALFDGEPRGGRYTEADDPSPITPYGEAKAAAEQLVEQIDATALVVRTSLIYGGAQPSDHERLVFDCLKGHADLAFFTDELRCPIAVGDLAAALPELAPRAISGRLHIAGAEVISRYGFAQAIAAAHGYDPRRLRAGSSVASGVRRPRNCALDISKAQHVVHLPLRGVNTVLGAMYCDRWLTAKGLLKGAL
jgi:dTDP-4-dehydrorhamnose reductase